MYYSLEHKRETSWFVQYQPLQKTNEKHEPEKRICYRSVS